MLRMFTVHMGGSPMILDDKRVVQVLPSNDPAHPGRNAVILYDFPTPYGAQNIYVDETFTDLSALLEAE